MHSSENRYLPHVAMIINKSVINKEAEITAQIIIHILSVPEKIEIIIADNAPYNAATVIFHNEIGGTLFL